MRKVHNCDINKCVTLYCPIENCNQSYDRYNALDTHLTHVHYAEIRKETFSFSDLTDFEAWLRDITSSSKTKYIKRSCNNSYRYYRCHRSGLPKTSQDKINTMKSSVKIGRHCPSRIIAKITDRNVQVEFVPTHIGHECEIAKIPLSQKKRLDIACRLANSGNSLSSSVAAVAIPNDVAQQSSQTQQSTQNQAQQSLNVPHNQQQHDQLIPQPTNTSDSVSSNQQTTAASIIHNDNSLMVTLAPMKSSTVMNDQQHQQLGHTMQQQQQAAHLIQAQAISHQPQQSQLSNSNTTNMSLVTQISPNRQELTGRFEQLMSSIRSDKHASIVKAQLEVCFALIRD